MMQFSFTMQLSVPLIFYLLLVSNTFLYLVNATQNDGQSSENGNNKIGLLLQVSQDQKSTDYDRFGTVFEVKRDLMRCYTPRETVLARMIIHRITTFANFKQDHDLVARFTNECHQKYFDMVTRALKEWGFIGDAIESWMKVMNDYFIDNGRLLSRIFKIFNPRSHPVLGEKLFRTFDGLKYDPGAYKFIARYF